jgi:hypothetical protein
VNTGSEIEFRTVRPDAENNCRLKPKTPHAARHRAAV